MSDPTATEEIVDYGRFDFPALWAGRDRVSEVERAIVKSALGASDRRRILEVGTGFGRLLGTLTGLGKEVVATDLDLGALERIPSANGSDRVLRVAANLFHLPFVAGSFTEATLVRVHHHLLDPVKALQEIARVLRPGAPLVVSYQPRPSVGTIVNDVQRALHRNVAESRTSVTFARGPVVLRTHPFPIRTVSRKQFREEARRAGFELTWEVGAGLEEYSPMRRFRAESFVRVGTFLGRAPAFPTRFTVVTKCGGPELPLPAATEILACPSCRTPRPGWSQGALLACDRCDFEGTQRGGILDLRFAPPGTRRWEVGE